MFLLAEMTGIEPASPERPLAFQTSADCLLSHISDELFKLTITKSHTTFMKTFEPLLDLSNLESAVVCRGVPRDAMEQCNSSRI